MDNAVEEIKAILNPEVEPEIEEVVEQEVEQEEVVVEQELAEETDDDIQTIAQLADAIEVEPDYLYSMQIGMGDNEEPVTLGELKDKYQASVRDGKAVQEQLAQQSEQLKQAQQGMGHQGQISQAMLQAQAQLEALNQQYQSTNFAEMEAGEAALLKQNFQEAYTVGQNQIGQIQQQESQMQQQYMAQAGQSLAQMIPEWNDSAVRTQEQGEIKQLMLDAGYSADIVGQISDPIAVALVRELMILRKEKKVASNAVRKVKQAPKVLRGARSSIKKGQRTKDLINKAKNDRSPDKGKSELAAAKAILGL